MLLVHGLAMGQHRVHSGMQSLPLQFALQLLPLNFALQTDFIERREWTSLQIRARAI